MRFIGFEDEGVRMIGRLDGESGETVQPVATVADFYERPRELLAVPDPSAGAARPRSAVTEAPPVPATSRVLCLGQNYLDHINEITEVGRVAPGFPNIFARWPSTLDVHEGSVPVPPGDVGLDWEAELAVIIGDRIEMSASASPADVMRAILGYTAFNDISARGLQKAVSQWTLGKNGDRSGPIGPEVVTPDEVGDPNNLSIGSRVNGVTRQDANTELMMFKIPDALTYAAKAMTLLPGDVLAMGTPAGVGMGHTPPIWMHPGDVVEVEIENIGVLRTHVV